MCCCRSIANSRRRWHFRAMRNFSSPEIYARAAGDYEAFWAECARELDWSRPFTKVLDWRPPRAKWFADGELNASVNCVDRHARGARRNKPALVWEGEPGDTQHAHVRGAAR